MARYTTKAGDCVSSIAETWGFFWETIWNHPENAQLRDLRKEPNILYPGDVVFIPQKRMKEESGSTEQKHRFVKRGVPAMFRLQLLDEDEPRANLPYTLDIDGKLISGITDAEGRLQHPMSPNARRAVLTIEGEDPLEFGLGNLDPIDTIAGVQGRLVNLGYDSGPIDNKLGSQTREAIKEFQLDRGLADSGELDEETRDALEHAYNS